MESPQVDAELLALKKRLDHLEEQVRTLTAANLALASSLEKLYRASASSPLTG
ncbi:hypothetical protein ACBI99_43885 [Nonomuraea sp. ATR24]